MIYFLDNSLQLQKIVTSKNIISAIHEHELNGLIRADVELDLSYANKFLVLGIDHVGYYYKDEFYLHKIQRVEYDHVNETATVVLRHIFFEDMIFGKLIQDVRPQNQDALTVSRQTIDANTRWQTIMTDVTGRLSTNFYWQVPYEVIEFMTKNYRIEYLPKILFDGQKINGFQLHLANKIGEDKNIRIPYGSRVLDLKYEEDYSEIITKLVVHGKGEEVGDGYGRRINISDVNFNRNGVKSPVGSLYLEDESITNTYGNDGQTPREGREVFEDIEDANELAEAGYQHYLQVSRPQMLFTADISDIGDVGIGDSVMIIRREYDVYFNARIHKLSVDLLYPEDAQVELGDYEHFKESRVERKTREKNNRVQGQLSDRITQLKLEANERFDNEVEQLKSEFEQALIDAEAQVEAKMEAHKELWEQKNAEIDDAIRRIIGGDVSVLDTNILDMRQMLSRKLEESDLDSIRQGLASTEEDLELTRQNLQGQLEEVEKGTEQKFSTVNQTISTIEGELSSKVEQAEVDTLKGTVDNHSTTLTQQATLLESKADQESLNTLEGTVTKQGTTLSQTAQELASKADTSELNTLKGTVSTQGTLLSQTSQELKAKANTSTVDTLTGRVSSAESDISIQAGIVTGLLSTQSEHESKITSLVASSEEVSSTVGSISKDLTSVKSDVSSVKQTASGLRQEVTALDKDVGSLQSWRSEKGSLYDQTAESVRIKAWKSDIDAVNIGINNLIPLSDIVNWESASVPAEWRKPWGAGEVWSGRQNSKYILVRSNYDSIKAGTTFGIYSPYLTEDLIEGETYTLGFNTFSWTYTVFDYMYIMYDDHPNQNLATPKHDRYTYGWSDNGVKNVSYQTLTFTPNKSGKARILFAKRIEEGEKTMFYINEPMLVKGNKLPVDFMPSQDDFIQQTDFVIQSDGFLLGTKKMGGDKFASAIVGNSTGLKLIGDNIDVTGNLNVQKSVKAWSLESVTANISSIRSDILKSNVVLSKHLKVDSALANKFNANSAFISRLEVKAANIRDLTATDIRGGVLSSINNSMRFDLMDNHLEFSSNATIDFLSTNNQFRMIYPSSTQDSRDVIVGFGTTRSSSGVNMAYFGGGHYDIDGSVQANGTGFAGLRVGGGSNDSRLTGTNVEVGHGNDNDDMYFRFDFEGSRTSRFARLRPPTSSDNYVLGGASTPFHSVYTWRLNRLRFTNLSGHTEMRYDNGGTNGAGFRFTETDVYFLRGGMWSLKEVADKSLDAYNSINASNGLREQIKNLAYRVSKLE